MRSDHSPLAKALLRKADLEGAVAEHPTWVDPSLLREIDQLEHSIVAYLRECGHGSVLESALHEARVEAEVSERALCSPCESKGGRHSPGYTQGCRTVSEIIAISPWETHSAFPVEPRQKCQTQAGVSVACPSLERHQCSRAK
jgi:hypothetical protein